MLADVRFDSRGDVVVARLTGEVDLSNATRLRDAIADATANTALGVVLVLSGVDYLDSAGIHLIYRLWDSLEARGQTLMLVIPEKSPVQDALRLAGVTNHLPIAQSVDEALAAFAPEAAREPAGGAGSSDGDAPKGKPAV